MFRLSICITTFLCINLFCSAEKNWPQPSGPNKNWTVQTNQPFPSKFSVRTKENLLWKISLPEVGQGGISIWEDKCFISTMKPITEISSKEDLKGSDILAICIDLKQQKILWKRKIKGNIKSPYAYGFSDSTTPGSVTDGKHVWFYNASGRLVCFDFQGNKIWERDWDPIEDLKEVHYPFNKQFEPILHNDQLINMETYWGSSQKRIYGWNYLVSINKNNGKLKWWSEKGLTHYNAPFYSTNKQGIQAVLIGRGGHHKVPETPKGYSLINLDDGKEIWQYEAQEGNALYNSTWNKDFALWYTEHENTIHILNSQDGKLIKKLSLTDNVDLRTFNTNTQMYELLKDIDLEKKFDYNVFPAWYSNIVVGDHVYFFCFKKNGKRLKRLGPQYCMGRLNLNTGKAEYLEVPVQYDLIQGKQQFIWNQDLSTETTNSNGLDIAFDKRSKRDGWVWNFNGSPICINNVIYFTLMSGIVYCIDTKANTFDKSALISVNDLGEKAKTWSLNSPAFANGKLYHRTMKELLCFEVKN